MQGEQLKELRKALGMTQAELGAAIGLTGTSIGLMERDVAPIEQRTALAARYLADRYSVDEVEDGRYAVVRRTVRKMDRPMAMAAIHGETMLYGLFRRRDHAYRWLAALRDSEDPRNTRSLIRERAADIRQHVRKAAGAQPAGA